MSNIPTVTVAQDFDKEVNVFIKFLNHPNFPQNRSMILKIYPELSEMIAKQGEKEAVTEFVKSFYQKHENDINRIVAESDKTLKNSEEALKQLGILMEYDWPEDTSYKAHPTILPFSPFKENKFFFSILNPLFGKGSIDVLYIAIHEISHFIFLDQLEKIEEKNDINFDNDFIYYFKETLTPAILNQKKLKAILGKDEILGNPNVRDINIKENGEVMSLIDYLTKKYEARANFEVFLEKTLSSLSKQKSEFIKKRELWNKNGREIFDSHDLMAIYKKPIEI